MTLTTMDGMTRLLLCYAREAIMEMDLKTRLAALL